VRAAFTAAERAEQLSKRLQQLADDPNINPFKVVVEETPVSSDLLVGSEILVSVFDSDARDFSGRTRHEVAVAAARKIDDAVAQYREERSPASLAIDGVETGATILAAGISEAMNCTAFGLSVAILGLIGFAILNGKTQSLEDDINSASVQVLNLVVANREKVNLQAAPAE